jgi:AraC-like DNA-binding protein
MVSKDSVMLIRLAYAAMLKLEIDADEVLKRCGLDTEKLADHQFRTAHTAQPHFWRVLEEVSGDPNIGLHLGKKVPPYRGHVIEYLFLSSPTFGDGLKRALSYQRLLSDVIHAQLSEDENGVYLHNIFEKGGLRHLNEAVVGGLITFFKFVTDDAFSPTLITFSHKSEVSADEYQQVFGCPVELGHLDARIYFNAKVLSHPSSHAEPELLSLHEKMASDSVARLEKLDSVGEVTRVIAEVLESGNANLEVVAQRLDLKPRMLRKRLAEVDTTFNQVLADYRCQLAKRLLSGTNENIDQIVYLTGFSEPSTFYRAFKRWENITPIEYRKAHTSELS